ncbi:MAG: hypothetical protein Q8N48_13515 [Thiobacillus sp.]|nr:hypothetical protein [Thiobacillus sp.]MDP2252854.1 hypothetical protein [Thiobacillus sp.]MDP2979834.1 hypothetical protein [Thiobacillus sp.]
MLKDLDAPAGALVVMDEQRFQARITALKGDEMIPYMLFFCVL